MQMNGTNYDHNNVYNYPSNSFHSGTYDTYGNAQDTNFINPLGFSNNFNTNSGNFVNSMTQANRQNVTDYQTFMDNNQGNLIDALKFGPKYENQMEPPYAN
jgi:hypothetical protein